MEGVSLIFSCCCGQSLTLHGLDEKAMQAILKEERDTHAKCREMLHERSKLEIEEARARAKDMAAALQGRAK